MLCERRCLDTVPKHIKEETWGNFNNYKAIKASIWIKIGSRITYMLQRARKNSKGTTYLAQRDARLHVEFWALWAHPFHKDWQCHGPRTQPQYNLRLGHEQAHLKDTSTIWSIATTKKGNIFATMVLKLKERNLLARWKQRPKFGVPYKRFDKVARSSELSVCSLSLSLSLLCMYVYFFNNLKHLKPFDFFFQWFKYWFKYSYHRKRSDIYVRQTVFQGL